LTALIFKIILFHEAPFSLLHKIPTVFVVFFLVFFLLTSTCASLRRVGYSLCGESRTQDCKGEVTLAVRTVRTAVRTAVLTASVIPP